ncbi:putative mediator of RNA polymerase II transcription subunit 17 [Drosophila navojoa]|uniref:putative mediator of RNA polymerase II transcription subunit 17 n=1 Tax=Drosophila navojoa TaxID=7232 RepID=UPI0011BE6221|nr:putative mediator of RNA polymerase II transcription subunit 17 [Drosophila navojoa]
MAIINLLLLSCLAYGVVALPPVPPYVSQIGAVSPGYRPGLQGPIAYGSVLGGGIGGVGGIGGIAGIGGIGGIGGYPYGRVNQQIPAYGPLVGRKLGAPVGIVGRRRINPGYQQAIVSPISSGYGYQGIPNKYSRGPY